MVLSTEDSKKWPKIRGFILSEILLAGAILICAIGGCVIVIGGLQSMLVSAQNGESAALIARRELAHAHLTEFSSLVNFQKTEQISGVNFEIIFSVSYRNAFTANVSADVSWQEGQSNKHREFTDQIVDWKNAAGVNSCDWLDSAAGQLSTNTSISVNAEDNNPITDLAVQGKYAFVSADGTVASSTDLYVVDISDINNIQIVARLNTGPGIAALVASSHYIFAANAGSYQLQVIDVADPIHPTLVSQAKMPGVTISGGAGYGQSIFYFDHKVYIGLVKANGPEFHMIDVSNPRAPIAVGSFEINSTVNDIAVQGNTAIVGTTGQQNVLKLDISHPANIQTLDSVSLAGWQTQSVRSVAVLGQNVFIGRTLGGFYSLNPEFLVLDRNFLSTTISNLPIDATVDDILVFGNFAYLTTSDTSKTFQIIRNNFSTSTNSSVLTMSLPFSSRAVALGCDNKAMYAITQNGQDFFHVFTLP